jgi:thioredoxin 1
MIEIIKFSRKTCVPCKVLTNFIGEIDLTEHNASLTEVDIDEVPAAIDEYKLTGVPTVVIKRNGVEITRFTGLRGTDEIVDAINVAKEAR